MHCRYSDDHTCEGIAASEDVLACHTAGGQAGRWVALTVESQLRVGIKLDGHGAQWCGL